jgi:chromosome segregation ATPase
MRLAALMESVAANVRQMLEKFSEHQHTGVRVDSEVSMPRLIRWFEKLIGSIEELEQKLHRQETDMGRAADAIKNLNSQLAVSQQARAELSTEYTQLQSQLATAQANAYDQADIDAINGVLNATSTSGTTGAPVGQVDLSNPPAGN